MSKAILVIDMPERCKNCMCYVLGAKNNFCEVTRFAIFDNGVRQGWCPLKPVPEKKLAYITSNDHLIGFGEGYNACIDDIIGE